MRLIVFMLFLLSIACSKLNFKSTYVQQKEINLATPFVLASNTIIDSSIVLKAAFSMHDANIYYTTDGTEPTENSKRYEKELFLNEGGIFKFKTFHKNWNASKTSVIKLYNKGQEINSIDWLTQADNKYKGQGARTLVNNLKATLSFKDKQWYGFDSPSIAKLTLKEKKFLQSITITYLVDTKSWIFPPEAVTLYFNENDSIHYQITEKALENEIKFDDLNIPINKTVESLTVKISNSNLPEWHPGNGNTAWLFMDEWILN